jgi:hypothetical protein
VGWMVTYTRQRQQQQLPSQHHTQQQCTSQEVLI